MLIVDASKLFRKGRAQNFLDPEHAERILGWVQDFADVEDRARVVSVEEIQQEGWTLNISLCAAAHRRGYSALECGDRRLQGSVDKGPRGRRDTWQDSD